MPQTKKKKKATPTTGKLAGKKVAFAGKFGYGNWDRDQMKDIVKLEGGKVVDGEKTTTGHSRRGHKLERASRSCREDSEEVSRCAGDERATLRSSQRQPPTNWIQSSAKHPVIGITGTR